VSKASRPASGLGIKIFFRDFARLGIPVTLTLDYVDV